MTLNAQVPWVIYQADGLQTVFPYDFFLKQASDLFVYWRDMLLPPGGYLVTGVGQPEGGNVVFPQPLPAGELILRRATPQNQLTDYVEGDAFPAESHEQGLDRLTVLVQDINERLSRVSTLGVTTGTAHRHLVLPDPLPNTVLGWDSAGAEWTLYPSGVTQIIVDPVSGIGWGKNTIALTPVAGATQGTGLLFPAGVLAVAVTVWVETTFGTTQGLQQVGFGTPALPDCWGLLPALSAETTTTAGLFQAYGGQPQLGGGMVALTAYGGRFDGTGTVYVTGHFMTFQAAQQAGYSYTPGSPDESQPLPPVTVPLASELEPGIIELLNATEVLQDTDLTRAVTIGRLVSRTATPARLGLVRTATPAAVVTGANDTDAATPLGVKTALDARLPSGTALRVPRYGASGTALESSALTSDPTTGNLGLRTTTPETGLHIASDVALHADVQLDSYRDNSSGVVLRGRRGRGTLATPARLQVGDILTGLEGWGYVRNAADTADALTNLAQLRFAVQSLDAQGRAGINLNCYLSPGVSAPAALRLRLTQDANLILGTTTLPGTDATATLALGPGVAPSTSPTDLVQLTAVDRGGVGGKRSLHVRTEDGTSHVLGDLVGLGTTLSATLGSGASYQKLNVLGSTLYVSQSSVQERAVGGVTAAWAVSTDATRQGRLTVSAYDATAAREGLRVEADGSAARLSFFGASAVSKPSVSGSRGGNAALASLLSALANLGLITDSSTA